MEQILGRALEKPRLYFFKPDLNQIYMQIGLTNARQQQPIIVEFQAVYDLNENKPYNDFAEDRAYGFEGINDKFIIRRNDVGIGTGSLWYRKDLINKDKESSKRLFRLLNQNLSDNFYAIFNVIKFFVDDYKRTGWYFDGYIMKSIHGVYTWEYDIENCILRRFNHPLNPDQSVKEIKLTDELEGIQSIKNRYIIEDSWGSFIKKQIYIFKKIFSN